MDFRKEVDCKISDFFAEYSISGKSIEVNFRELVHWEAYSESYTHYLHKYPAKLIKHIPIFFLSSSIISKDVRNVLDPFCGTGTVLLESIIRGLNIAGADANPLARLIAKVKTTKLNNIELEVLLENILFKYKKTRPSKKIIDNVVNVDYWFPLRTQNSLARIKQSIDFCCDGENRDFFLVCLSSVVKKLSYADPNVSVPVSLKGKLNKFPERIDLKDYVENIESSDTLNVFISQVFEYIKKINTLPSVVDNCSKSIDCEDAKALSIHSFFETESSSELFDLVITSPPYAGAQKYIRSSSLNLGWLGLCEKYKLRDLESKNIGREHFRIDEFSNDIAFDIPEIDDKIKSIGEKNYLRMQICVNYLKEMSISLSNVFYSLKKTKYFILVAGNNIVCGEEFETAKYLRLLSEKIGFTTRAVLVDSIKSRGLMTKRNKSASVITCEYVIIFQK